MKKLIIILLLAVTFSAKGQTRYELYVDSIGYNHVSTSAEPLVAIWGYFSNLLGKPTDLTGYGVTNTITINGTTSALSTNPSFSISTSVPVITVLTKSANYTIVSGDFGAAKVLYVNADATSGNITITLPAYSSFGGYTIYVRKTDATTNLVTTSGVDQDYTIDQKGWVKMYIPSGPSWVNN